jgi:hypothetical protein
MSDGTGPAVAGARSCRLVRRARLGPFRTRGRTGGLWRLVWVLVRLGGELFCNRSTATGTCPTDHAVAASSSSTSRARAGSMCTPGPMVVATVTDRK